MKRTAILATLILPLFLSGCLSSLNGTTYSRTEARQVQYVEYGVVQATAPVVIEGSQGPVGALAGSVVGGIIASNIGGGRGKNIATTLGAVAGGVAGNKAEEAITRAQGQEITVRLGSGQLISVVQEVANGPVFKVGERVRVLTQGSTARVAY